MLVCPFCESINLIKGKKKYRCLDCHKSFSTPKGGTGKSVPIRDTDVKSMDRVMRKLTRPKFGHIAR